MKSKSIHFFLNILRPKECPLFQTRDTFAELENIVFWRELEVLKTSQLFYIDELVDVAFGVSHFDIKIVSVEPVSSSIGEHEANCSCFENRGEPVVIIFTRNLEKDTYYKV